MRLVTIGGYGFDERGFIEALRAADVDVFVDIRQRRGLRGRRYAFLNSSRLQAWLAEAGIRYFHLRELAPTQAVRDVQKAGDADAGVEKRTRTRLSPDFADAYRSEVLSGFDISLFRSAVGDARVVALFCVEGHPEACHRSIAADFIAPEVGAQVEHIRP